MTTKTKVQSVTTMGTGLGDMVLNMIRRLRTEQRCSLATLLFPSGLAPSKRDDLERKVDDSQRHSMYQHFGVELM